MIIDLMQLLKEGNHSLVVANGYIRTFNKRGILDLYNILKEEPEFLQDAEIADKIVGKGAAAIMIVGGVKSLSTYVISTPALELLRKSSVKTEYIMEVDNIINRDGDGICPVEQLCMDCVTAKECLPLIENFLETK